jgi:hypothetical protein
MTTKQIEKDEAARAMTSAQMEAAREMRRALAALVDQPTMYAGNDIIITADSHWDGIERMLAARAALRDADAAGIGE